MSGVKSQLWINQNECVYVYKQQLRTSDSKEHDNGKVIAREGNCRNIEGFQKTGNWEVEDVEIAQRSTRIESRKT